MKHNLPLAIQKAIRNYKEIELGGLVYYPILMDEIDEWEMVKPAVELMLQRLPAQYAVMPFLSALHAYDYDLLRSQNRASGLFAKIVLYLCLCLRLGRGESPEQRTKRIQVLVDPKDPRTLKALQFTWDGEEIVKITPRDYGKIREALAAQNGMSIADESKNLELVDADLDMKSRSGVALEYDTDVLISSVASACGVDEEEVMNWPVLKFQRRKAAIDRRLKYLICGIGEASGAKWKGGNPCPSWCLERAAESAALIPMSQFMATAGAGAVDRTQGEGGATG